MVSFSSCPTVGAGHGIPRCVAGGSHKLEPSIFVRSAKLNAVSKDMGDGYAKSVREHAPQAVNCIDNYHVVQLATKALDEVRREHRNELRGTSDRDAVELFKDARWSVLKKPRGPDRPLGRHARRDPRRRREGPTRLGDEGDGPRVCTRPHGIRRRRVDRPAPGPTVPRSRLKPFIRLGRTIRKHPDGILAPRRLKLSNAHAEAPNNKAEVIVGRT